MSCEDALQGTEWDNLQADQFTDWIDLSSRRGFQHQHSLSLSGGSDATRYYISGAVLNIDGVALNDTFERYTARLNLDQEVGPSVEVGLSAQLSQTDRGGLPPSFTAAFLANPLTPAFEEDGRRIRIVPWPEDPQRPNPLDNLNAIDDDIRRRSVVSSYLEARANEPGVPFMDQFYDGNVNRNQGNTEVLWAFQYRKGAVGAGDPIMRRSWLPMYERIPGMQISMETGGRGVTRLAPTRWAIDNYEPEDHRGSHHAIRRFLLYNDPASLPDGAELGDTVWLSRTEPERFGVVPDWPWPRKWESVDPLNVVGNEDVGPQPALRLAETYLLLAEAQFNQGKLDEAAQTLNIVRGRANASMITAAQVTQDFILDEHSRELMAEGQRRYTLLRMGKWLERTRAHNPIAGPNVAEHNVLFPIPQAVIDANTGRPMAQNPGY